MHELERVDVDSFKGIKKRPITVVLDGVRSALNIGSVFRTADGFAIDKIYLCGITATPPHRDINKTGLGAQDSVAWEYFDSVEDAIMKLKDDGVKVLALEQTDDKIMLQDFDPTPGDPYAFVMGNEVMGVSDEALAICDGVIEIPQFGTKHSFNISVTTGMVLWHYFFKTQDQ